VIKKIIRILFVSTLFLAASPLTNASAAVTNIISGKPFSYYLSGTLQTTNYMNMTDGNMSTSALIVNSRRYDMVLPENYHVTSYQTAMNTTSALGYVRITFYSNPDFTGSLGTINGKSAQTAINYDKVRAIRITTTTSNQYNLYEFRLWGEPSTVNHEEVTGLAASDKTLNSITLNWTNPTNNLDFTGVKVYRNNTLIKTLDKTQTSYTDSNLQQDTSYNYKVAATYSDGFEATGQTIAAKTAAPPKPPGEVKALNAYATHKKVELSWTLPTSENFKMVRIYRDQVETAFLGGLFGTTAYAAETPIFETNGTYFNDLSVKPSTKYEYMLTTVSNEGLESNGVTTQVTTKEEPAPQMDGISYLDENGNLIFTWKQPTTGTVKVFVDGQEYETVPASNGTITIPKDQVPYSMFGEPKVTFQAIGEYGTPGQVHTPSMKNIETPFGAIDLVNSGMGLLALIAPFLLVALSFLLVPKLRKVLFQALAAAKNKKELPTDQDRRSQGEPKERHEGKEYLEKKERIERERQEREKRERLERDKERAAKEIKENQEKETRERTRQPRESREKSFKAFGRVREPRAARTPRERTRQPRAPRLPREKRR
jgi:fibronectin type 3 domain-containing protein